MMRRAACLLFLAVVFQNNASDADAFQVAPSTAVHPCVSLRNSKTGYHSFTKPAQNNVFLMSLSSSSSSSRRQQPHYMTVVGDETEKEEEESPLETDEVKANMKMEKKVKGRKKRVVMGYRIGSVAYLVASIVAVVKNGISPFQSYFVAGPLLAAGMAHTLADAALHDRLSSDTYKRLNLFLGTYYGLVNLILSSMTKRQFGSNPFWSFWTITSFITCVNCIKGYGYGVKGWKLEGDTLPLVKKDLAEGMKYTFQSLVSIPKNAQSAGYWIAMGTVASLKMKKLVEIIGLLLVVSSTSTSTSWGMVATRLSRYAKLALLTGVMFTLKDAADRGRLNGTTFIQLNLLSSYVFGSMSAYLYQEAGSTITGLVGATTFFSVMTVFNAVVSLVLKRKKNGN
eukprot:scaffold299225_cov59-Attheya_sp.AAC.2